MLPAVEMCNSSFFAFTFVPVDTARWGHPLLATLKQPKPYANESLEQRLKVCNDSAIKTWRDHFDTLAPRLFAGIDDSIFFVRFDDFRWTYTPEDKTGFFPGRKVFVIRNGQLVPKWESELDLFGVPCD